MTRIKNFMKCKMDAISKRMEIFDGISGADKASRATRFGKTALVFGILLESIEPIVSFVIVMVLACMPTMAQGGTIFGQDQSMIPNAVRQTVIFAAGIAFLVGAGGVIWGVFLYMRQKDCNDWIIGGGLLMSVGGIIALVSYLASGRAVTVDRTLN